MNALDIAVYRIRDVISKRHIGKRRKVERKGSVGVHVKTKKRRGGEG